PQQIGVTPVYRGTDLETALVVEGDKVRGIGQAGDGKRRARGVVRRELAIGVDKRGVRLNTETRISEHVLQRDFEAANVGFRPVHLTIDVENGVLPGERIDEPGVRLLVNAAN